MPQVENLYLAGCQLIDWPKDLASERVLLGIGWRIRAREITI